MKTKIFGAVMLSFALMSSGLILATDAAAYPAEGYTIIYFANETSYAPVGKETLKCNGAHNTTGTVTDYYEMEIENCSGYTPGQSIPCAMGMESEVCHYYGYSW